MRRFELSDGSSDKFWEVSRSGSDVTVHYGRIGTNGQTKLKDLGSEDKAKANVEKLIREKTAKGYVEVGGAEEPAADAVEPDGTSAGSATPTMSESAADDTPAAEPEPAVEPAAAARPTASATAPAELPDEATFVVPGPWKRSVLPIRGVDKVTAPKPVADAAETARALRRDLAEAVEASFLHDEAAPELVAVARSVDLEAAEPGPALGVAVHLRAMTEVVRWDRRDEIESFVPDLLERHGGRARRGAGQLRADPLLAGLESGRRPAAPRGTRRPRPVAHARPAPAGPSDLRGGRRRHPRRGDRPARGRP